MKRISYGCIIIGTMSIILSFIGVFVPLDGLIRWNMPFLCLIISLQCGAIPFPKQVIGGFLDIISSPVLDYIFSIILIISGVGTILAKPWGRILGYIYAMSIIFLLTAGFPLILIGYIMAILTEKYGFLQGLLWGGALIYILALLAALLYPILLLIFFSRPRVKEMFGSKDGAIRTLSS